MFTVRIKTNMNPQAHRTPPLHQPGGPGMGGEMPNFEMPPMAGPEAASGDVQNRLSQAREAMSSVMGGAREAMSGVAQDAKTAAASAEVMAARQEWRTLGAPAVKEAAKQVVENTGLHVTTDRQGRPSVDIHAKNLFEMDKLAVTKYPALAVARYATRGIDGKKVYRAARSGARVVGTTAKAYAGQRRERKGAKSAAQTDVQSEPSMDTDYAMAE